jgi:hypothetical protein
MENKIQSMSNAKVKVVYLSRLIDGLIEMNTKITTLATDFTNGVLPILTMSLTPLFQT